MSDIPVYVHVKEVEATGGRVEALEINYCTLYAHNGPYPLGGRYAGHCMCVRRRRKRESGEREREMRGQKKTDRYL